MAAYSYALIEDAPAAAAAAAAYSMAT